MIHSQAGEDRKDTMEGLDMVGRYEAMLLLGDEGNLRIDVLERLCLEDEEPFMRKRALRMLSARKERGFIDVLAKALSDTDPMVRIIAAEQIYSAALDGERVNLCETLRPLLRDADPGVRLRSVSLLMNSREKDAAGHVLDLFFEALEGEMDEREAVRIAPLVGRIKNRKAVRLLRKRMDRLDEETRLTGIKTLEREGIDIARSSWF